MKHIIEYILNKDKELTSKFFRYLKMLPHLPRLWWHQLWVREDEFHHSLDMDMQAMSKMDKNGQNRYLQDLIRRRNIAHERDFQIKTKR